MGLKGLLFAREILELMAMRKQTRADKNCAKPDRLLDEIQALGNMVQDGKAGMQVIKQQALQTGLCVIMFA